MRLRLWLLAAVALMAVRVAAANVALDSGATDLDGAFSEDPYRWHQIAASTGRPYRDFEVEYPPVTLAAIEALDGGSYRGTLTRMTWFQLALDGGCAAILAWGWGRRAALAYLLLGLPLALWPFVYFRLDLLSVALAIGAVALVHRRHERAGGVVLALACFAKVWPLAIVPLLVVRRQWRALAAFGAAGAAGLAAWIGFGGLDGPVQVLTYRGAKGWEIESVVGAVVHATSGGAAALEQGAVRVGAVPMWAASSLAIAGAALVGAIWWRARTTTAPVVLEGVAPVGAVAGVLVTATIISPQYVVWLLPFAAIAAAAGERPVALVTGAAVVLTTLEYELFDSVTGRDPAALLVLLLRNATLVALYFVAVSSLTRGDRSPTAPTLAPGQEVAGRSLGPRR